MTEKQETKAESFVNQQTLDLNISGLEGTVTIPRILDDRDFAMYLKYTNKNKREPEELTDAEVLEQSLKYRYESTRHIVKGITFPGVTLQNFRPNGKRPSYPALVHAIANLIDPIIRDALNLPNS